MTTPWEDLEVLDDALLPSEDDLTDLADDYGWTPEAEPLFEDDE